MKNVGSICKEVIVVVAILAVMATPHRTLLMATFHEVIVLDVIIVEIVTSRVHVMN